MTAFQFDNQKYGNIWTPLKQFPFLFLLFSLFLLFKSLPWWIYHLDSTVALPDAGIWAVILLAVIVFLLMVALSAYLFKMLLKYLGFPAFSSMVLQFKKLELWQQFVCYGLVYALLFWGAIGCLIAVC